jgi:hypothetical protein
MPTWASAPASSAMAMSPGARTPPATVSRASPARSASSRTRSAGSPPMCPSRSTKVTRNPPSVLAELVDAVLDAGARAPGPALDDDLVVAGVEGGDHALAGERERISGVAAVPRMTLRAPVVEPPDRGVDVADTPAHAAGGDVEQLADEPGVRAGPERRVEVDDRDLADAPEALGDGARVARLDDQLLAARELDGLPPMRSIDGMITGRPHLHARAGERGLDVPDGGVARRGRSRRRGRRRRRPRTRPPCGRPRSPRPRR